MGQNQSLPEGTGFIVIDEDLQITASRKCDDQTEEGHTRPLPPPRSREDVISTIQTFCSPKTIPPTDDTTRPTGTKRPIEEVDIVQSPESSKVYPDAHTPSTERKAQNEETQVLSTTLPSEGVQPPRKKKRLFANEQAVKAAQEISEQSVKREDESTSLDSTTSEGREVVQASDIMEIDTTNPPSDQVKVRTSSHVVKRYGPFVDDDSQDEGYYTYSQSSAENSFNEDDGDELVRSLAKMHQRSYASNSSLTNPQVPTPPDSPTLRKLQEEDESAEQSRKLREQKLSGQAVNRDKYEDFIASSSFQGDNLILSDEEAVVTGGHHTRRTDRDDNKSPHSDHRASSRRRDGVSAQHVPAYAKRYGGGVDSPDSEDSELDHQLDMAQSFKTRTPLPKARLRKINPKTPSYRRFPTRANPYSRHTAERYRTQGRHLSTPAPTQEAEDVMVKGSSHGEDRLRAQTNKPIESSSLPQPLPTFNRSPSPIQRPSQRFHAIDLASSHPRRMTTHRAPYVDDAGLESSTGGSPLETETLSSNEVTEPAAEATNRPLSMLEMMASRAEQRAKPVSLSTKHDDGPSLDPGVVADIDYDDEDQVREEHERLKEQQKDLGSIETTGLAIASIRALGPLNAIEAKEEQEFQRFLSLVFDAKRSGKSRRDRMTKIRSNFERRLGREDRIAPSNRVREEYIRLLGAKRLELLDNIRDPLVDLVHEIGAKRKTLTMKRHNVKNYKKASSFRKQVRFADAVTDRETGRIQQDIEDSTVIDFDEPRQKKKKKTRPLGKEAREMILLEEKLKLAKDRYSNVGHSDTNPAPIQAQEPESEVSEEDSEAEYVSGARRNLSANSSFTASSSFPAQRSQRELRIDQDIEETNRLENERQEQDDASGASRSSYAPSKPRPAPTGAQRPDPELVERMKQAAISRQKEADAEYPFDDLAEASDSEASVASASSSCSVETSSSDNPATVQQFRYEVFGQFVGVDIYHPEEVYRFKRFFNLGKANEHVRTVVSQFVAEALIQGEHKRVEIEEEDEMLTILVSLGRDRVQGKVWIEKDIIEIDTHKIEAGKARRAILGEERGHWAVDWEKKVTTTVIVQPAATELKENNSTPTSTGLTGEEDEDLFGRSPSPPPAAPTTTEQVVVTRPTPDEVYSNMYTSVALANRKAKELFIAWFAQFCDEKDRPHWGTMQPASGSRYRGYLGAKDMALEGELERLGDQGLGCWEEDVEEEAEVETLKVWVRRVGVKGPQN